MDQSRDIYLRKVSDNSIYGYYLQQSGAQKHWSRRPAVTGPTEKIQWKINTWNRGGGYDRLEDEARYNTAVGIDPRRYHELQLMSAAEDINTSNNMETASPHTKRYFAWFASNWWCAYEKNIYAYSGGAWVLCTTTTEFITSLVVYKTWLCVGQLSGGYYYSLNGTSYTQSATAMVKFFTERHLLWGSAAGKIYNCEDPTNGADPLFTWSTAVDIGNASSDVEGFALLNQQLLIRKKEGLYHYHWDGDVTQVWTQAQDVNAEWDIYTEAMVNWTGYLVMGDERNRSVWLFTPDGDIIDIHPRNWVDAAFCSPTAIPGDMCVVANYLIMELGGDIYGCWLELSDSHLSPRFFKILALGPYTFEHVSCSPAQGIGWLDGYLYYPRRAFTGILSDASTDRVPFLGTPASTGDFVAAASLQSSGYDQYPDKYKVFQRLWYRATSLPDNSTVTISCTPESGTESEALDVDTEDAWTSVDFVVPVVGKLVYLNITVVADGEDTPNTEQLTITDLILEGYVVQDIDSVFEFDVLCMADADGTTGPELEDFLFSAATDTLPLNLTAPNGGVYTVRILPGYPQSAIVADQNGKQQHMCRVVAQQVPAATFVPPDLPD
jgi:hypothetical protein